MNANKQLHIDSIKNRIYRNFPEAKYDPIINIFIDACAAEFAQIRDEVDDFKINFIHELSKGFARGLVFSSKPAHALLTCSPNANQLLIPAFSKFNFQITNPMFTGIENITFSSVFDYRIYNHKITTIQSGKYLWCIISSPDTNFKLSDLLGNNDFLLHFEMENDDEKQTRLFKYYLAKCKVDFYFENSELLKQAGQAHLKKVDLKRKEVSNTSSPLTETNDDNTISIKDFDIKSQNSFLANVTNEFFKESMSFYADSFFNLFLSKIEDNEIAFDEVFSKEISQLNLSNLPADHRHLYLRIDTTPMLDYNINFDSLRINLNCFPVFNIELLQLTNQIINSKTQPFNLKMPDKYSAFFGLLNVTETIISDQNIQTVNVLETNPQNIHLYSSGINRLSNTDADELINKLILKYDTEPIAFEKYKDVIEALKSKLKFKLFDVQVRDSSIVDKDSVYMFYTPDQAIKTGSLEVKYLVTNGRLANGFHNVNLDKLITATNITSGNPLEIDSNSTRFITPSIGGRDALNENEKSFEFWNVFYSKGSIVTAEDVRNYCYHFFGEYIKDIEIKKRYVHDDLIAQRGNVMIEVWITILISELKDQKNKPLFLNEAALLQHFLNNKANASLNEFSVNLVFSQF
jgi:hypothetical protein